MKRLEQAIIEGAAARLEGNIDYALLEMAAKFMVYSYLLERACDSDEDVREMFNNAIRGLSFYNEDEIMQVGVVLDFCLELADYYREDDEDNEEEDNGDYPDL